MNIYKVSQNINNDYDTFDSMVVVTNDEDEARRIHPKRSWGLPNDEGWEDYLWVPFADIDKLKVEYIGEADASQEIGVILASFNAG
jgi:hypothetical protein